MKTCRSDVVIAIDPGNFQSAYCFIDRASLRPIRFGLVDNDELRDIIARPVISYSLDGAERESAIREAAIEMVRSYGMAVGAEVFDTCVWIGRFTEVCLSAGIETSYVYRMDEKLHICHDSRAKDANIRTALIDRFAEHDRKNGRGTKKKPDWFYGFKKDIWAAYAVGITYIERGGGASG